MKKYEFLAQLEKRLKNIGQKDEVLSYYQELIDGGLLNGEDEEKLIESLGNIESIVHAISNEPEFVDHLKTKKNFNIEYVFTTTINIISFFIMGLIVFTGAVLIISLFGGGLGYIYRFVVSIILGLSGASSILIAYEFFNLLTGIGAILFGIGLYKLIFSDLGSKFQRIKIKLASKQSKEKK